MNIIVSGISCSGKSTFASKINDSLHFEEDWYFKDKKDIPLIRKVYLFDSINAFNVEELKNDVSNLLKSGWVYVPNYDVVNNRRINKNKKVDLTELNVFEGLHMISILNHIDGVRVFLDTDLDLCLKRRILRDKKFGISESEVIRYFKEVMLPMYECYILPQRDSADYIVKGSEEELCLLKKFQKY